MAYNSAYTGQQIDAAVGAVRQKETKWDNKQDELTGTEDQLVGFNSAGEAIAVAKPTYTASDVGAIPAPTGGTDGQILAKTADGVAWEDKPVFWVTISTNDNGETFTADHTAKEVYEAYQSGNVVFAKSWEQESSVMNLLFSAKNDIDSSDVYQCYFMTVTSSSVIYASIVTYPPSMSQNDTVFAGVDYIQADYISFSAKTTGLTSDNVQDAIEEVNEKISSGLSISAVSATLYSDNWTQSEGKYTQAVQISGVTTSARLILPDPDTPGDDQQADEEVLQAWGAGPAKIAPSPGSGAITFYSWTQPTINIPIQVVVIT